MEVLTPETTDRMGVASLVQSREKVIDVVRGRLSVVGDRLDQLFNQCADRNLSGLCNVLRTPKSVIIYFQNYLFHTLKLTAMSGRVKIREAGVEGSNASDPFDTNDG